MFCQYHVYEVEAEDEWDAEKKAYPKFTSETSSSIANTYYDEVEVECLDEDEDDEYEEEEK